MMVTKEGEGWFWLMVVINSRRVDIWEGDAGFRVAKGRVANSPEWEGQGPQCGAQQESSEGRAPHPPCSEDSIQVS